MKNPVTWVFFAYFVAFLLFVRHAWNDNIYHGKVATVNGESRTYQAAVIFYYLKFRAIPDKVEKLLDKDYHHISKFIPTIDPWENEYQYVYLGKNKFKIISLGSDGKEGGKGTAKDLIYNFKVNTKDN
ncbi:type II secretion system protein GspG [Candidatus Uabimicrobium sp. HlEnr_7]|uniref:type II secretion system protein GspG n=1 Tax=Candidatus Uabimicrobium helgolandensis TaxID=3095367 RepID=UPI0035568564